jgi:hypothetical protein
VVAALVLPADWRVWGQNLAQATRWSAVGKQLMSTPSSAMSSWAAVGPIPVIASSWVAWAANGAMACSMVPVSVAIWAVTVSMRSSIIRHNSA